MLERMIAHEMADKGIPAVSVALIDDQTVVWARGFGLARRRDSLPATAETVYRVGSVSKVFTAIAVMQLVERGIVALDSPVTHYLPEFRPASSWYQPITVRHLLSHRAGLVREPPVGGYGDRRAPSLVETVASLNRTSLVYPPGSSTKYSNAGLAVAGALVERMSGEPFAEYVQRHVLQPLGEDATSFTPTADLSGRLATGLMWAPEGRSDAPSFELGIAPATGLYSTALDLGRLLSAIFAAGTRVRGILRPQTLEAMWELQSGDPEARQGYGLGFHVSTLDGRRRVGHDGAVYGFATTMAFLPEERLGVAVIVTLDLATGVTTRVADAALRALLAVRAGRPVPEPLVTRAVPPDLARQLAGRYGTRHRHLDLTERGGVLFVTPGTLGVPERLGMIGNTLVADDRMDFGERLRPVPDGLVSGRDTLRRAALAKPAPTPERWKGVVGAYAALDSSVVVYVFERDRLFVQVGWLFADALNEGLNGALRFSETSLYAGEHVVFQRDSSGRATAVEVGGVRLPRLAVGPEDGRQLRVPPLRPVSDLLRAARAATPPAERGPVRAPDLVDLAPIDSTFRFDIRYATTDNFLGSVFYAQARAFLQRPAAEALARVQRRLKESGYGLLIHDGYRPWYVTKVFWDATPPALRWLVADPAAGSRHNRGCAVDVALYKLDNGRAVNMGGSYDEASERSFVYYPVATARQSWRRALLRQAMAAEGFTSYEAEWWHFDYRDWREYPILNVPFEELGGSASTALVPGGHQFRLRHDGRDRNYILHVPPQAASGAPLPVLIVFHGGGGHAGSIERYSRFDAIADREGFLAVYPNGTGSWRRRLLAWNAGTCCGLPADQQVDDVGFALAVLDDVARRTPVDSTRVYATGHSNGAMMAYRLAIATGRIAAVAVVAGGVATDFTPPRPIPVLHIHSVDDPRALYAGGLGPPFPLTNRRVMHSAIEPMLEQWRALDGCAPQALVGDTLRGAAGSLNAGQTAVKLVWGPCREGTEVAFWKLTGAGHGWPSTPDERFQEIIGPRTTLIDASEEVWRFVSRFRH